MEKVTSYRGFVIAEDKSKSLLIFTEMEWMYVEEDLREMEWKDSSVQGAINYIDDFLDTAID